MGTAKKSNTNRAQTFRNISLRPLSNASHDISNLTLHNDFHMWAIEEQYLLHMYLLNCEHCK